MPFDETIGIGNVLALAIQIIALMFVGTIICLKMVLFWVHAGVLRVS